MADKELGALSPIETLFAAALFYTVQQGNSRKVTAQQIADFVNGNYPVFIQTLLSAQNADDVYAAIGAAPDADKLGGQSPSFFASAEAVDDALTGKVSTSRTVAGKPLTDNITLTKADVGLANVNNTSDANKPVSIAQAEAINAKVAGPNGGVAANDLAVFADTTGTILKKAPNNVVGNALLSQLAAPAIKGRLTTGTGNVEDLTPAQARQVLGGWEYITTLTLDGQSSVVVNNLGGWRHLRIHFRGDVPNNDFSRIHYSTDNGSTFVIDPANYLFAIVEKVDGNANPIASSGTLGGLILSNAAGAGVFTFFDFNAPRNSFYSGSISFYTTGMGVRSLSQLALKPTGANAIRFTSSLGNVFTYGDVRLEGIR